MTGVRRLSQIARGTQPPGPGDQFLGVSQGTLDTLWSTDQAAAAIAPLATAETSGIVVPDGITTFVNASGVISAPSTGGGMSIRSVTVTPAQFEVLGSSPVPVVPAPGADQMIVVVSVTYSVVSGSGAYTGGEGVGLFYGAPSNGIQADLYGDRGLPETTGENFTSMSVGVNAAGVQDVSSNFAGQPVNYGSPVGAPYVGGGYNMMITVLYYIAPCVPGTP